MAHVMCDDNNDIVVEQIDSPTRRRMEERYARLKLDEKCDIAVEQIDSPTRRRIEERYARLTLDEKREILVNTIDQMLDHLEHEAAAKQTPPTPPTKRRVKITKLK